MIYIWKILENLVPPLSDADNGGQVKLHSRIGRTMSLPAMNNKCPQAIQTIRDSSLAVHGAKLFNCLPRSIRDATKCATLEFKATLDKFLSTIPDEPLVTGYTQLRSADSNSLISLVPKKVPRTTF